MVPSFHFRNHKCVRITSNFEDSNMTCDSPKSMCHFKIDIIIWRKRKSEGNVGNPHNQMILSIFARTSWSITIDELQGAELDSICSTLACNFSDLVAREWFYRKCSWHKNVCLLCKTSITRTLLRLFFYSSSSFQRYLHVRVWFFNVASEQLSLRYHY